MEIGAEISKKIRAAIKGKLQELGAYIDEELPDYIMVMVANKKTSQQMTEDLSLFLGNNTIKFTTWLHGVLEKLRSVAGEPAALRQLQSDTVTVLGMSSVDENGRAEDGKLLTVSSSWTEAPVSSSAYDSRKVMQEKGFSNVRPLAEPLPLEAVIDIKPDMDDDLIAEEPIEMGSRRTPSTAGRPMAEIYRPGHSKFASVSSLEMYRPTKESSNVRQQDNRSSRVSRTELSKQEEMSRKRKAPVISSVVRVNRADDEDSEDAEDDEDTSFGGRSLSSRVSLPSKPERKPTLPPAKQANRNLILKAISEAQDSVTKTTSYPTMPQKRMVPVAPRTRLASSKEMTAALQLMHNLQSLVPRVEAYTAADQPASRTTTRSLASRLQLDPGDARQQREYGVETPDGREPKVSDTRSFIMSRPILQEGSVRNQQQVQPPPLPRTVQAREGVDTSSPKFIVTLDGVPSPLGNLTEGDMELDDERPLTKAAETAGHIYRASKVSVLDRLQGVVTSSEDERMDKEIEGEDDLIVKKPRVMERCKFWPVCKSGDECMYHHPTAQCKTFPNCKFGDKCLFVHPNCKYDARCTKPDCPFTHVSRRGAVAPPLRPAVQQSQSPTVCRFFPECKKVDCPFYHPKPCRFATQCKRAGCTFYHPTAAVPPRHALKWTKDRAAN